VTSSVEDIEGSGFEDSPFLEIVELESELSLSTIGPAAFTGCRIQQMSFPDSVFTIEYSAFEKYRFLTDLKWTIDSGLDIVAVDEFLSTEPSSKEISGSVTVIGDKAIMRNGPMEIRFGAVPRLKVIVSHVFWMRRLNQISFQTRLKDR
jgi:hypothetical protein